MRWLLLIGIVAALWWFFCRRRRGDAPDGALTSIGTKSRRVLFALGRLPGDLAIDGPTDLSTTTNYGRGGGCGCK